jgi:hypothetical protein
MSSELSSDLARVSERCSSALQEYRKAIRDVEELKEAQASNLREHTDFVEESARRLAVRCQSSRMPAINAVHFLCPLPVICTGGYNNGFPHGCLNLSAVASRFSSWEPIGGKGKNWMP